MTDNVQPRQSQSRKIEILKMDLLGGGREVPFKPGLNIVQGEISSGKTTFVRLIRSLLGAVPSGLPPETEHIRGILAEVKLGHKEWQIFRPLVTTPTAPVDIAEVEHDPEEEPTALRLPAGGKGQPYSGFLLDQISVPAVSVPRARTKPTEALVPVTMTDWLGYCIVTGDEIDTQVFGHSHPFRDSKRRSVFELAYGFYNAEVASKAAELRSLELRIDAIDRDASTIASLISATPFADSRSLSRELARLEQELNEIRDTQERVGENASNIVGVRELRSTVLSLRARQAELAEQGRRVEGQLEDLRDLERQLKSQAARLTRAIVADEWLVDFDFIVCPRCGNDIDAGRVDASHCYLCLQEPRQATSRDDLLVEQNRITEQISETESVIAARSETLRELHRNQEQVTLSVREANAALDRATLTFVSERATELEFNAARRAGLEADIRRLREYLEVHQKLGSQENERATLDERREQVLSEINALELSEADPDKNVKALEKRMLSYLKRLNIPEFDAGLTVKINRKNFMPVVSGRNFDELSSQGLKTLVNVAHALAHHTVTIDLDLPMPGFLVLDGLSANAGYEGFDIARVSDIYNLLQEVSNEYGDSLQIVAVDNELPNSLLLSMIDRVILSIDHTDRLLRIPSPAEED